MPLQTVELALPALFSCNTEPLARRSRSAFLELPTELHLCIRDFLRPADQASLALTCKHLQSIFAKSWKQIRSDTHERLCFFQVLDASLPHHRYCAGCQKFHTRPRDATENQFLTRNSRTSCDELNVPLVEDLYLSWPALQLRLRRWIYRSAQYGSTTPLPTYLPNTRDAEGLIWHHDLEWTDVDGRLMLCVCSSRKWHGRYWYSNQTVRGFHITVEYQLKDNLAILCVRRLIDVASLTFWENEQYPGWQPSMDKRRVLYNMSTGIYDTTACLPGLHWTELPPERRGSPLNEWSRWAWCSRTGEPYNVGQNKHNVGQHDYKDEVTESV